MSRCTAPLRSRNSSSVRPVLNSSGSSYIISTRGVSFVAITATACTPASRRSRRVSLRVHRTCHLAIKTDELVTWLPALCHAMPEQATIEACIGLRIHARVHWDVGQSYELGACHSAPMSPEPFATPNFSHGLGRPRACFSLPSHATVVSRRPAFLPTLLSEPG